MKAGELVYLDTSGVVALLDADDACHARAVRAWEAALAAGARFITTDYARLECWSLLQRRLGVAAADDFRRLILPLCDIHGVGEEGFQLLARQVTLSRRRDLSMVDLSAFACIDALAIRRALAFDTHFSERGLLTPEEAGWEGE